MSNNENIKEKTSLEYNLTLINEFIDNSNIGKLDSFIHIHPVSRWLFKCISDDTMSQIIDYCELELGLRVVITASEDDLEIQKVERIIALAKSDPINLSGILTLKQVAALNKKAKLLGYEK